MISHAQKSDKIVKKIDNIIKVNNYKNIADKIIRILKNIKNEQNVSSRRWVWELIQNATDVKYDNEKVSIQIILDKDKLIFKHNGKYFRIKDIFSLLQQVSSKDSQNLEGQTGKFGTGFIGTHLLSDIVDIKGIIHLEGNDFREFQVSLDRGEQKSEILAKNIQKSIELFLQINERSDIFKLRPNYLGKRKETDYDTIFTYHLNDEEKKESAIKGINDLINTVPTTLITQHDKIKQITIIDNIRQIKTTYIPTINDHENENDITESSIKIINRNNKNEMFEINYYFLSYLRVERNKKVLRLITEINKDEHGNIVLFPKNENRPVLYRNFPLIGSNEFNMPFIVDGFDFNPLETRSGLFLNGAKNDNNIDSIENLKILHKAFESSISFIQCILKKFDYLRNRFLLASSKMQKPIVTFDEFAKNWFLEMQKEYRKNLRDFPIVLSNESYHNLSQLLLPVFNEKYNNEFYRIVVNLNIRKKKIPQFEYYKNWYNIIVEENNQIQGVGIKKNDFIKSWGFTKNEKTGKDEINYIYDEEDLLKDIEICKNIKNLCKELNNNKEEVIDSLNHFLKFLRNNCKYEEILNRYPIIPNRNGDFKRIEELYSDDKNIIPKDVIDIYDSISSKKLSDELIDPNIKLENLGDLLKKKDFDSISTYLNNYILNNKEKENTKKLVVYPILSIKSDREEVSKIYQFLNRFYKLKERKIISTDNKTRIPIDFWTHALKFWFNEHPKEIEKYQNIKGLKNGLIKKDIDNISLLKWMNDYLDFLNSQSSNKNFQNLKIFPNQNGDFCALNTLHFDSGFPEEFKDILKKYFQIDIRAKLLDKNILAYKTHQIMPEIDITDAIKNQFNKLKESKQNESIVEELAFEILCLYPINKGKETIQKYIETIICPLRTSKKTKVDEIENLGFAEIVYNKKNKFSYKNISTKHLDYMIFINYIIEKICFRIEKCSTFENIKKNFYGIKDLNALEKFLIKLAKFIWDSQNSDYCIKSCIDFNTSAKTVFLNMSETNKLLSIKDIKIKINSILSKEEEEIILNLGKNKYINKDYRSMLLNENLSKGLSSYKNKFAPYDIKQICSEIDQSIMKYDQEMLKKEEKYDKDFFVLTKIINNLKIKKDLMKELFPFFWKNRSRIIINCIDEDEKEKIISYLCGDKSKLNIIENNKSNKNNDKKKTKIESLKIDKKEDLIIPKKTENINNKNNDKKKIKFENLKIIKKEEIKIPKKICYINKTIKSVKNITIQQKFNFKIILDQKDKNNFIQYKPIILPSEIMKINNNNEYINDISFEITPKEKKIDYEKNNNLAYSSKGKLCIINI